MRVTSVVLLCGALIAAQEGASTLPRNYRILLENEWVKVTSVRYEPKQQLPAHTHTAHPTVFVYLNDGPAVVFRHVGGPVSTRRPTRAGSFRVTYARQEVHEVENLGDAPSEFLRIELPTVRFERGDRMSGLFNRPAVPSATPAVQFDQRQFRVSRIWVLPGTTKDVADAGYPSLLVVLQGGPGSKPGDVRWLSPGTALRMTNADARPIELLRVDFK